MVDVENAFSLGVPGDSEDRSRHAHATAVQLEAAMDAVLRSPSESGSVNLIVRRPRAGEREALQEGRLEVREGLVGDTWKSRTSGGSGPDVDFQLSLMNSRVVALLLGRDKNRWLLTGDQLFIDFDVSIRNLPAGTQLTVGTAIIEITTPAHKTCRSFAEKVGHPAVRLLNTPFARELRLRGVNAKVVRDGTVRVGDSIRKAATDVKMESC